MSLLYPVYLGVPLATITINASLIYWIRTRHGAVRGAGWFQVILGLGICWMALKLVELTVLDHGVRYVAHQLAIKAAALSFLTWIPFVARYTHTDFHTHPLVRGLLVVTVVATALPTTWKPLERVFFDGFRYPTNPFPHVVVEYGIGTILVAVAIVALNAYALYRLLAYMLATRRQAGLQLAMLALGALSVATVLALNSFDVFPVETLDHSTYGVLPFTIFTSLALFRFRLFDIQPVARNKVVETLQDPVIVLDSDRSIVDYNRAASDLWPTVDDSMGNSLEVCCPELATELTGEGGTIEAPDRLAVDVGGHNRYYSVTVSTTGTDPGGAVALYAILLRDVTSIEQSRWQLQRQNERLDQVASTISHDLRNPLNVADGYGEMLADVLDAEEIDAEDRETAREHLEKVLRSTDRMAEIIDDVLTLAREGQSVQEPTRLCLATVAEAAWENVATEEATLSIRDDRWLVADRSRLLTLFENLYRNSVEHAGADATVTIESLAEGFAVADDGPGIPDAEAETVFEYGYSTGEDGTGLGLSIVQTIAESHGWMVALDSEADGARFVFTNVDREHVTDR